MPRSTLLLLGILWLILAVVLIVSQVVVSPAIKLEWQTETEFETAGFNILKSERETGVYTQINDKLIASQADPAAGASYVFTDEDVVAGRTYYYRLEDVEFDNTSAAHEVLTVQAPSRPVWIIPVAALCAALGLGMMLYGFRIASGKNNGSKSNPK
jgi:hypothetical protein